MDDNDLELRDYLSILRRRWIWVLLPLSIVPLIAGYNSSRSDDVFRSTTSVILQTSAAQDATGQGNFSTSKLARDMENEINVANGDEVVNAVANALGFVPAVSVSNPDFADILQFTATADDPETAALAANTWAQTYVDTSRSRAQSSVDTAVDQLQSRLRALRLERQTLRTDLVALEDDELELTGQISAEQAILDQRIQVVLANDGVPALDDDVLASQTRISNLQAQLDQAALARQRLAGELEPELNVIDSQVASIARNIADLELSGELAASGTARINSFAAPSATPINAPIGRSIALGAVVGAILGGGLALLVENLDRRVKTPSDLEQASGTPVLAVIPTTDRADGEPALMTLRAPTSPVADGYHKLRSALQFVSQSRRLRSIVVTSANESEGKTASAANLAWAIAATGKKVVLIDADLRRPRLHKVYGAVLSPGLTDVLLSDLKIADAVATVQHEGNEMVVLAAGTMPPNPGDFLASPSFTSLLRQVVEGADMVVIDAPPVLPVADALTIAPHVDGVLLVSLAGSTTKDEVGTAARLVEQAGGTVLGTALIGADVSAVYGRSAYYGNNPKADKPPSLQVTSGSGINTNGSDAVKLFPVASEQ